MSDEIPAEQVHIVEPFLVDAKEAARSLKISPRMLWTLTNRGDIPCVRIGRRMLYRVASLSAYVIEQEQKGREPRVRGAARASARPTGVHSTGGEA